MARRWLAVVLAVALLVPSTVQAADGPRGCQPGERPTFGQGFAALKDTLGATMGDPTSCPYYGDATYQDTTTGLAYWRSAANAPTFTNGSEHWALTADGLVYWTSADADPPTAESVARQVGVSVDLVRATMAATGKVAAAITLADLEAAGGPDVAAPPQPPAPAPLPPAAAASAPPPAAPGRALILVGGLNSDLDSTVSALNVLAQSYLSAANRRPGPDLMEWYSYCGQGCAYGWQETQQALDQSAGILRRDIRRFHTEHHGMVVGVAGYSLGGLVALHAFTQATDPRDAPDAVVTFDSPLNGTNLRAKASVQSTYQANTLALGVLGGLVLPGALAGASAAGGIAGLFVNVIPTGPIGQDLQAIYDDARWRGARNVAVQAGIRRGLRLGTAANAQDCMYWLYLCAQSAGQSDTDDRWTMHLGISGEQRWDRSIEVAPHHAIGAQDVDPAHHLILRDTDLLRQAERYLFD